MSSDPLIGISFTSVTFHSLLEKIDKINKISEDKAYFENVRELLQPYYQVMEIDENEEMISHFEKYNNGKIKKINSKTIGDYINNNFIPYIKKYVDDNKRLLLFLTPLIVFNFRKIYEYYNLMISEDIAKCQDQIAMSILEIDEYKRKEKENKEEVKTLKNKNNNLEKKVSQLNEEIKKLSQEMQNKDEETKKRNEKIHQEFSQMEKKISELKKNAKEMEVNHKKEIEKYSKEMENHEKESYEKFKNIEEDIIQIKSKLKRKNTKLKIAKYMINNMENKYEKLKDLQNIITADDYSNKLTIKEKSQEIFENKFYIKKLQYRNNILNSKNEILNEENIRIKQLIGNKSCEKNEKDRKESLELIEMELEIQRLNKKIKELEENNNNISGIINDLLSDRKKVQVFNDGELRERTKYYFSINYQRIRELESIIIMKNFIIRNFKKKQRKYSW